LEICRSAIEKSGNLIVEKSGNLVSDANNAAALKLQQTLTSLEPLPQTNSQQQKQQLHQVILPIQPHQQQTVLQPQQQQHIITTTSNFMPFVTSNSQFVSSQSRFVNSAGNTTQAVLVKTSDGKTLLATAAPGQLMRQIRPMTFQNLQPHLQHQQHQQGQIGLSLPTMPLPSMKISPASPQQQMVVIPSNLSENGDHQQQHQQQQLQHQQQQQQQQIQIQQQQQQQQQLFRVPVSTSATGGGAIFVDSAKQTHVIPQAVLVCYCFT
jgi:hypothetical protein